MLFLLLTIICSSSIALILKFNASRKGHPLVMLMGNYFTASLIASVIIFIRKDFSFSIETFSFGFILGTMFIGSFFIFAKAVETAGTALATVSSRLSVFIPVLLVVLLFGEEPSTQNYFGFALTVLTIILFYFSLNRKNQVDGHKLKYLFLVGVLLFIGINDSAMKFFQILRTSNEESLFVYMIFTTAFITGLFIIIFRKIKIYSKDILTGFILGIPNVFSTIFLLAALSTLPAIVVYPVMNIGVILITTISAYIIWRETLNGYGISAVVLGTAAILLLGM
ncbi:MAG: EamA family transporter [Ignavibacterium sp.]|nr:EamA family transporter [Ignavibacterium sp.]